MASISNGPGGRRMIQFVAGDGRRRTVRLGKVTQRVAEEVKVKVEALNAAAISGVSWDAETARWVAGLAPVLADRLARAGLIPRRQAAAGSRLGKFLEDYIAGRTDAEESTATALRTGAKRLVAYFGADRELGSITPGDADDWSRWLLERLAEATAGRTVKWARQFFRTALRKRLIPENPFAEVKAPGDGNSSRKFFVSREAFRKVLDACPDAEWRLLFALSRYGGLRCPSEHRGLDWADVDWERGRMRVTSPKTRRHPGKGERWIPIFPELRPFLEEAFEQAADGAVHVIDRHRITHRGVRKMLLRTLRQAGLSPWPRLFQNLRASRETELAAEYPMHVVCAWIGNSPAIAAKHYLQVTDADFERAAKSGAAPAPGALHIPVQQPAATSREETQGGRKAGQDCELVREVASGGGPLPEALGVSARSGTGRPARPPRRAGPRSGCRPRGGRALSSAGLRRRTPARPGRRRAASRSSPSRPAGSPRAC
jgi:integrase